MNWTTVLIVGGILAYPYIHTALSLLKLDFAFGGIRLKKMTDECITVGVILQIKNNSRQSIFFQSIKADITLNERIIGKIDNTYHFYINPTGVEYFEIIFDINKQHAGDNLWNLIQTRNTNIRLGITGTVEANSKPFPLTIKYTTDSIIEMIHLDE